MSDLDMELRDYMRQAVDQVVPVTPDEVIEQVHERGRWGWLPRRTWLAVAAVALLVGVTVAVGVLVDRPDGPGSVLIGPETGDWVAFRSDAHGFEIRYPPDWNRAEDSLVPQLAMPWEVLTITTGPTLAGSDCGPVADRAMRALDDDGTMITIMSRGPDTETFPAKPDRFSISDAIRVTTGQCAPHGFWHRRFDFQEHGRAFYAYVTVGPQADRDVALEVLNTFRVIDGQTVKQVEIPDVVGMPLDEAINRLDEAGLDHRVVRQSVQNQNLVGQVIAQSPPAGPTAATPPERATTDHWVITLMIGAQPDGG